MRLLLFIFFCVIVKLGPIGADVIPCDDGHSPTQFNNGTNACRNQLMWEYRGSTKYRLQVVHTYDKAKNKEVTLYSLAKELVFFDQIKFAGAPDYEFVLYSDDYNILDRRGRMTIQPKPTEVLFGEGSINQRLDLGEKCTGEIGSAECAYRPTGIYILPPVISAQMDTKPKLSFRYGKVEIRAKLPKGDWIYPELYLTPATNHYGPGYDSGQIRIAYVAGNEGFDKTLYGGIVLGTSKEARSYGMKQLESNSSWTEDFHTYTVLWEPTSITFSVDGNEYGKIEPPPNGFSSLAKLGIPNQTKLKWRSSYSKMAPFDKEMYIVFGVGVGGFNFDDDSYPNKPWKNGERSTLKKFYDAKEKWLPTWGNHSKLILEYIKVWAL